MTLYLGTPAFETEMVVDIKHYCMATDKRHEWFDIQITSVSDADQVLHGRYLWMT